MLKLFEEVENIEKNEGVDALTNEKICELCEKYNISMTELKNLVIEILSAGEITGFSDNEKSLENVAGGKMILKKGTATLLAALSTTSPFADTFAANPSRKITGSRDVCVVSHKKSTAQKGNLKNPAIKALDFTKKIFAEYIPQKQEDAIKYTQKKFRTTHEKAKLAVLAAEAIATTSLIATTGLIYNKFSSKNYVPFDLLSERINKEEFELRKHSEVVSYVIIKIDLQAQEKPLYSKFDVRQDASNHSVTLTAEPPECGESNTLTITVNEQEAQKIFGINKLTNGTIMNPRWSNELTNTLRQLISSAALSARENDDYDEKDEIESSGHLIKIPSIEKTDKLLDEVKKHENVIIVYHKPGSDYCDIFLPDDEDGIAWEALEKSQKHLKTMNHLSGSQFYINVFLQHDGYGRSIMNDPDYKYLLAELKKHENITILELENIEGDVKSLICGRHTHSNRKEFAEKVLNYREEQRRTEIAESSKRQEEVTGKFIKLESLRKKDDLLEIVKKHKNVIIVHHDSEYNHCHILLPDDENGIALNALNNISEDLLGEEFTSEDGMYIPDMNDKQYEHFLSELKKQKDITILKLEKINGEIAVLFTGHGYKSFENFAEEVLNYREEQRKTEIAESSKEQEGFTKEALRDTPNKMIKLKSLSKKEDLLQIVKENQNVIIVHRKENQESQTQTDVSVFLPYKAERNSLLKSFDKYSDFDFHSLEENFEYAKFTTDQQEYKSLLNVFKDKNVTVLELENIKGEVEYLLKPGFCGYVRRKGFAKRVLDAIEQEQQHTPNPIASSSSSDTTTNDQRSISKQTPIRENAIDPSKKSDKQKPGLLQNVVQGLQSWLLPRNWGNHSEDWQKFTQDSRESVEEAIKRFLKEKLQASDLHSCSTTDDIIDQLKEKGISSDEIVLCSFSGSGSDVLFKVSVLNQNSETEKFDDIKLEQKSECKKPDSDWKKEIIEKINEQFQSKSGTPLLIVNDTIMQQLNSDQKLKDDMFSKFNSTRSNSNDGTTWIDQIGN